MLAVAPKDHSIPLHVNLHNVVIIMQVYWQPFWT